MHDTLPGGGWEQSDPPLFLCEAMNQRNLHHRHLLWLTLLLAITSTGCGRRASTHVLSETATTPDGWKIALTHFVPDRPSPAIILLAHRYGGDQEVWQGAARRLAQAGYLVTTFDFRGHGESRTREGVATDYRTLPESAWQEALQDFATARAAAVAAGGDGSNIAAGGEGMGADLALYYGLAEPTVQAVLLFSPGLMDHNIDTLAAMQRLRQTPSLLIAGTSDTASARAVSALQSAAPVFAEMRTYETSAHGADILAVVPDALDQWVRWLNTIFGTPQ